MQDRGPVGSLGLMMPLAHHLPGGARVQYCRGESGPGTSGRASLTGLVAAGAGPASAIAKGLLPFAAAVACPDPPPVCALAEHPPAGPAPHPPFLPHCSLMPLDCWNVPPPPGPEGEGIHEDFIDTLTVGVGGEMFVWAGPRRVVLGVGTSHGLCAEGRG